MLQRGTGKRVLAFGVGTALTVGCHSLAPAPEPLAPRAAIYSGAPTVPQRFAALAPGTLVPAAVAPATTFATLSGATTPTAAGVERSEKRPVQFARLDEPNVPAVPPEAAPPAPENALDLDVALRLAGIDNPTVNLARERVREALAEQLAARALLLPSVNVGGNLRIHRGPLQDDPGEFRQVNLQSLYLGAGTGAIGANPAALPGVRLFAHLGDAVYEPLAARQRVTVRRSDAQAVQNQVLLEVSIAYLNLIGAEAQRDILRQAETEVNEIVRVIGEFAKTGQGAPSDANRASATADLIRRQLRQVEGGVSVSSARLCRLLNLDPSVRLRSPGGPVESVRLVPEDTDTELLLAEAVRIRPELLAAVSAIKEAQTRVRQEQVRPLFPTVSVGYSAGGFGGGSNLVNPSFGSLNGRSDFDVVAVWNVSNLGFGNRARVRRADAIVGQSVAGYDDVLNRIRSEVVAAQADARAAALQITVTRSALKAAEEGYRLERERIKRSEGRPIEGLDSFRQLIDARMELLGALVAFNSAQFRLFVALGSNPASGSQIADAGARQGGSVTAPPKPPQP